jgi:hypothetical protein
MPLPGKCQCGADRKSVVEMALETGLGQFDRKLIGQSATAIGWLIFPTYLLFTMRSSIVEAEDLKTLSLVRPNS